MIPKECTRLAEVDFPIAVVSKHAAREKSIRHGHPSTLHLWWARRPLAACRAMLLGLLLPDPCDQHCPADFKERARRLLEKVQGRPGGTDDELRKHLLRFIGDFANWDLAASAQYMEVSRGLVKAAHGDEIPLVVDPFAGGGSIPLEALRLGCDTFASDLNPVACLILKVVLEDIPRYGPELATELREAGNEIREAAERGLRELYPLDSDGAKPITYLWARTVRCESPNCGAEIPLLRSFWLCKKASRKWALKPSVRRPKGGTPQIDYEIYEPSDEREVQSGTVSRAKARCLCCNAVLPPGRVRAQLTTQQGGADVVFDRNGRRTGGARLTAIVTLKNGAQGRNYRPPTERDYDAVYKAVKRLEQLTLQAARANKTSPVPNERIPRTELRRISVPLYGIELFCNLFTARQGLCLAKLAENSCILDKAVINRLVVLSLDKTADLNNANTRWKPDAECPVQTLARHDLPMAWDFAEAAPLGTTSGSFLSAVERTADSIGPTYCASISSAATQEADACSHPLPDDSAKVWFTDPPYYDSVPYAHLSDFFFVWEKRALVSFDKFKTDELTPKLQECVVDRPHSLIPEAKTADHFEERIRTAMQEGVRITERDGIACVVFAHKTTEGWEALLSGMIKAGWVIKASWPIVTEMQSRLNARDNASLAASVHLVCRPRSENALIGDWTDVLRELPNRVSDWMNRLQDEGIRGADLVFACIGPALEIFSRYSKVETAEGGEVKLAEFLEKVWELVGKIALAQVLGPSEGKAETGAEGALEEDARLTALFLWTLQSSNGGNADSSGDEETGESDNAEEDDDTPQGKTKGFSLIFDVARRFAQPLGIHLPDWEGRIIETEKGVVRLLPVSERTKQLFGEEGADIVADQLERGSKTAPQLNLFPDREENVTVKGRGRSKAKASTISDESLQTRREATTLDRVHAAMLLQKGGRASALRTLLKAEQDRSPDFLRLANALSALYPKDSEEKRLLDAMLLAVPR